MFKGILLLFAIFVLAGCAQRAQGAAPSAAGGTTGVAEVSTAASGASGTNDTGAADTGAPRTAAIALAPAAGYAGTFVSVTGTGWPPSAMVLVKLADAQGRSPVLAAVATDAKGQFTTGFVYPVGERWLHPGSAAVIAHTENGKVETTAPFTVAPPAGVMPPTSTPTAAPAVSPTVTTTIPFTSGALAATPAPTVTPVPTATPLPTVTTASAPPVTTPATPIPTAQPSATVASTATVAQTVAPTVDHDAYSDPVSTIAALIAAIRSMPPGDLAPELVNSLVQKLNNAQKQVDKGHATPASNMLRAFQHEVAAQRGKKIAADAATFLTVSADSVIARLQADQPGADGAGGDDNGKNNGKGNDKGKDNDKGNGKGNRQVTATEMARARVKGRADLT